MAKQRQLVVFEEFMKVGNFFLVTSGLELYSRAPSTPSRRCTLWFVAIIMIGNLWICTASEIIQAIIVYTRGQYRDSTAAAIYVSTVFIASFKILSMFHNKTAIIEFISKLKDIFPKDMRAQKEYKVFKYYRQSTVYSIVFSVLYMTIIWMINLLVLFQYLLLEVWLKRKKVGTQLPYFPYVPWDYQYHWSYIFLYIMEALAGYTTIAITVAADLILCASTMHLVMHFDYLCRCIVNYQLQSSQKDLNFLKRVVIYHNHLFSLTQKMNELFGAAMFFNFFASSFVICFCGLQLTLNTSGLEIFRFFFLLLVNLLQVFLICFYGQRLYNASTNIAYAVFKQNWHAADLRFRRMLVLIACRSQTPAWLKATFFLRVTHESMALIINISYKFFALLRTMLANNKF